MAGNKRKTRKKAASAAAQLRDIGTTVDNLDKWAVLMAAWCKGTYEWAVKVHHHTWPKTNLLEVPQPPPAPPSYPPKAL